MPRTVASGCGASAFQCAASPRRVLVEISTERGHTLSVSVVDYPTRTRIFGVPGTQSSLVLVTTPWGLKARVHHLIAERFLAAATLAHARSSWTPKRIDSYAPRKVRGSTAVSLHAYGLACDWFDLPLTQTPDIWGPTNAPDQTFRRAFAELGFRLGADYQGRKDYPHIEWAGGVPATAGPVRVASSSIKVVPPEPEQGPVDAPPVVQLVGEGEGVKTHVEQIGWEHLDDQGRGFVDVAYPLERVLSVIGQGSSPPEDGYWEPIIVTAQPRGASTRVTLKGKPGQGGAVYAHILDEA